MHMSAIQRPFEAIKQGACYVRDRPDTAMYVVGGAIAAGELSLGYGFLSPTLFLLGAASREAIRGALWLPAKPGKLPGLVNTFAAGTTASAFLLSALGTIYLHDPARETLKLIGGCGVSVGMLYAAFKVLNRGTLRSAYFDKKNGMWNWIGRDHGDSGSGGGRGGRIRFKRPWSRRGYASVTLPIHDRTPR
jgi:hypothetical protein